MRLYLQQQLEPRPGRPCRSKRELNDANRKRGPLDIQKATKERQYNQDKGFSRMVWQVLEWNEPAINFYKKYKANLDPEWINGILDV